MGWLCRQVLAITLVPSNHLQRVTAVTGFSHTAASQENFWYLCSAALRRSRGVQQPGCESHLERSAWFCFSIMRSMASALCVTSCSVLPVVVTFGRGMGCKLTEKTRHRRTRVEGRFRVNKRCLSATFNGGPIRFGREG